MATYDEHCPDHVLETLGPPPPIDAAEHDPWAKTAFAIEQYRLRWTITDPHQPLGDQPTEPLQRADHLQAALALARHRDLDLQRTRERDQPRAWPRHRPEPVSVHSLQISQPIRPFMGDAGGLPHTRWQAGERAWHRGQTRA